jgi:hypothetical protein
MVGSEADSRRICSRQRLSQRFERPNSASRGAGVSSGKNFICLTKVRTAES